MPVHHLAQNGSPTGQVLTRTSTSGYPNVLLMNSTFFSLRASGSSKARTYPVSFVKNCLSEARGARSSETCAAICQDGQGVGTEPICGLCSKLVRVNTGKRRPTNRTSPLSAHGFVVNHSHIKALVEPSFTEATRPWISFLTERKIRIFQIEQKKAMLTLKRDCVGGPLLAERHDGSHSLAAAAWTRDTESRPLQIFDLLVCSVCTSDNSP